MAKKKEIVPAKAVESLFNKVSNLIEQARVRVATAMNVAEVYTKYQIGRYIVEEEQSGNKRAEYGKQVLEGLSKRLTERYGDGWSYSNLRQVRQFFLVYGNLTDSVCQISNTQNFTLSWSHYQVLMRIKNADERRFYEIEATSGNWSVRELQRQYGSNLYNRLLQCYVLVDLNVDKLTHQDLGQMQMYVNYYDRYVKQNFEKPTIGILLCKEKKDTLVKLTLPEDANIYASAYELYLPDKKLLQAKVKEWVNEFESQDGREVT